MIDFNEGPKPNPNAGPSLPQNSPLTNTATNIEGNAFGVGILSEVDEAAAVQANGVHLTPQGALNDLMKLRSEYPFLAIMPLPHVSLTLYLAAGAAQEIAIPSGASMMMVRGSADYYVSRHGRAEIVTAANASSNKNFFAPEGCAFYCGGVQSLSFVAPADGTIITAMFYFTNQWPEA